MLPTERIGSVEGDEIAKSLICSLHTVYLRCSKSYKYEQLLPTENF